MQRTLVSAVAWVLLAAVPQAGAQTATLVYGLVGSGTPRMRTWSAGAWSGESNLPAMGIESPWIVVRECPTRTELIAVVLDTNKVLRATVHNGSGWGAVTTLCSDTVTIDGRPFDLAYESVTGDAVVVYRNGNAAQYRVWNGSAWSSAAAMPNGSSAEYIRLVPDPASDEIVFGALTNSLAVNAAVWTGTTWANAVTMSHSVYTISDEAFDLAYEASTGRCLLVWTSSTTQRPRHRIWSGASWLAEAAAFDPGSQTLYIRLAARPATATVIAATLDNDKDLNAAVWNGAAWGAPSELTADTGISDRRVFDLAYEPSGTSALIVYRDASNAAPRWRTYTGAWSAATAGPGLGAAPEIIHLGAVGSGSDILAAIDRGPSGLCVLRWTGAALGSFQSLASDLGGSSGGQSFFLAPQATPAGSLARILDWRESDPYRP